MEIKTLGLVLTGIFAAVGCDQPAATTTGEPVTKPVVTMEDVQQEAIESMNTTAAFTEQNKDQLMKDMKAQLAVMDANIEKLRIKGSQLANDAKVEWDLKMVDLELKRKEANEKMKDIGTSTSQAWSDVEKGAKSAWLELEKAFQNASKEF